MSNYAPTNHNMQTQSISCFITRERRRIFIECLLRHKASMVLIAHSEISGAMILKVLILMCRTIKAEDDREVVWRRQIASIIQGRRWSRGNNSQNSWMLTNDPSLAVSKPVEGFKWFGDGCNMNIMQERRKMKKEPARFCLISFQGSLFAPDQYWRWTMDVLWES